ncbi:MAG: transglutaminase family protein [Cyanobacteria bacterium J06643_4]
MRYKITHTTHYQYAQPVNLHPHSLRLCPRSDGAQWLQSFDLSYSSTPVKEISFLDAYGNTCNKITFHEPLSELKIQAVSKVHTTRTNPFDYLSEPWALQLPIDYPTSVETQLSPYLTKSFGSTVAPNVVQLATSLAAESSGNVSDFLLRLTQLIPNMCTYQQRLEGEAYAPGVTLEKKSGTCRDFTVLFMAICRAVGLAARFVSGYQEGDLSYQHDLHAWAEVYIPGGGWRGFDPTLGLAVGDRHVAIAASLNPKHAAPVTGTLKTTEPIQTQLITNISIEAQAEAQVESQEQ